MAESLRFDEGITSVDVPSVLTTLTQGEIFSLSLNQVISGGGSPCRIETEGAGEYETSNSNTRVKLFLVLQTNILIVSRFV